MVRRVTFDTNVLDLACRPERFPKDPRQPMFHKVNAALKSGAIEGFYSVTMLTIEGIMKRDRAEVYAGTKTVIASEDVGITKNADIPEAVRAWIGDGDIETIKIEMRVEQPDRKPLHPEVIARVQAAKSLGVKILKAVPRNGAFAIDDSNGDYYLSNGEGERLSKWLEISQQVAREIEDRGVGIAQVKALGKKLGAATPAQVWFQALDKAGDVHERGAVERAFAEWADGDSVASHISYGLDVFCSADVGKSNATNSVLDSNNRAWLESTYGVKFMTIEDLAASLP